LVPALRKPRHTDCIFGVTTQPTHRLRAVRPPTAPRLCFCSGCSGTGGRWVMRMPSPAATVPAGR
jgi:hypothetical protein